jgi:glycosyltransferase involved in cell wall biosynthesis
VDRFREKSIGYNWIKLLEFSVINNADASIICTEARKKQIAGSRPKLLAVIHNTPGYATPAKDTAFEVSAEKIKIAYVGCFEENRFLKELLSIVMEDARFELHIGGFGLYEAYILQCSQKCDRIIFYGKLLYDHVLALEEKCDIISAMYNPVALNNRFAAPNKLYESMMLSKPVIMCENTGWDDVITSNKIGVIAKPSKEGIKQALEELIENQSSWGEMGKRSHALYQNTYSWDIMNERVKSLYRKLYRGEET